MWFQLRGTNSSLPASRCIGWLQSPCPRRKRAATTTHDQAKVSSKAFALAIASSLFTATAICLNLGSRSWPGFQAKSTSALGLETPSPPAAACQCRPLLLRPCPAQQAALGLGLGLLKTFEQTGDIIIAVAAIKLLQYMHGVHTYILRCIHQNHNYPALCLFFLSLSLSISLYFCLLLSLAPSLNTHTQTHTHIDPSTIWAKHIPRIPVGLPTQPGVNSLIIPHAGHSVTATHSLNIHATEIHNGTEHGTPGEPVKPDKIPRIFI